MSDTKNNYYQIVTAAHPEDLSDKVNTLYKDGWRPKGGVAVNHSEHISVRLCQAMIKYAQGGIVEPKEFHIGGDRALPLMVNINKLPDAGCMITPPVREYLKEDK